MAAMWPSATAAALFSRPRTALSMKHLFDIGRHRAAIRAGKPSNGVSLIVPSSDSGQYFPPLDPMDPYYFSKLLREEMPVRFAHRIHDLQELPYALGKMPSIQKVQKWYDVSMHEILDLKPIETEADHQALVKVLSSIYARHADTLVVIAKGLNEFMRSEEGQHALKDQNADSLSELQEVHDFLDGFFVSRIGIRVLIGHFLELEAPPRDKYVGLICEQTSPTDVAMQAAEDAKFMCERQYGMAPSVELLGRTDLTFAYEPSHLYYILFELLKNSMRAVTEHHHDADFLPDIGVVIADGEDNEDVVIKISDLGGGIPRSITSQMFSYLFTTAPAVATDGEELDLQDFGRNNPLAGLGYGLPIARSYCRYFGGELSLVSMDGYGTDAFVHLSRLMPRQEPLP